jgi:hypothetical protein
MSDALVDLTVKRPLPKFADPDRTAKGEQRAMVPLDRLDTLWINTGSLCNITCANCYIESSPRNDRLAYISLAEVEAYLDEIAELGLETSEIGVTGGEPFLNREIIPILRVCLEHAADAASAAEGGAARVEGGTWQAAHPPCQPRPLCPRIS